MVASSKKSKNDLFDEAESLIEEKPGVTWHEHPTKKGLIVIEISPAIAATLDLEKISRLVVIDYGSRAAKGILARVLEDGRVLIFCCILSSHLKKIPQKSLTGSKGFFAEPEEEITAPSNLSFAFADEHGVTETYAFGEKASGLGANLELDQSKTVGMAQRTIGALIGMGIPDGDLILGAQIIFADGAQWTTDENQTHHVLGKRLNFTEKSRNRAYNVLKDQLLVAPEDFYAEQFAWKVGFDSQNNKYPCWQGMPRILLGIGFRTVNVTVIGKNDRFDPIRSRSINLGTNIFYKDSARLLGGHSNAFDPDFHDSINKLIALSPEDYPAPNTLTKINTLGKRIPFKDALEACQTAHQSFLNSLYGKLELNTNIDSDSAPDPSSISVLFSNIGRFVIVGGGAIPFGEQLADKLSEYEAYVCPFSEGASAAGQFFAMAKRK